MEIRRLEKRSYPPLLKEISPVPEFLNMAGEDPPLSSKYLCVVGSRNYTDYGKIVCDHLISGLAGYDIVIVSGLAIGIDSLAHISAMKAKLHTIAFPGSGLNKDILYPRTHLGLAEKIIKFGGTLLSPFADDQTAADWTFPMRNRLMAGISQATLIIEAGHRSGTLLTAQYAMDFNRDILVVPGSIFSENSYGPHLLMQDGAKPIYSSSDILSSLDIPIKESRDQSRDAKNLDMSDLEIKILELLLEPLSADKIVEMTGADTSTVSAALLNLELQGFVAEIQGKMQRIR